MRLSLRRLPRLAAPMALLAGLGVLASLSARSEETALGLSYRVYVSGVKVGKANIILRQDGDSYMVAATAKSLGAVGWFYEVEARVSSEGRIGAGNEVRPAAFSMSSVTRGSEEFEMSMPFEGDAPRTVEAIPPLREVHYAVEPSAQRGALDPLSALVAALMPADASAPCGRTIPVFDGRRRFDLVIEPPRREFESKGYRHVACDARYKRVGGFKEKHMAKPDIPFTVDFAFTDDGLAKPVRLSGDSPFGSIVAQMRKY